jgi:hypothetical protein
VARRANRKSYLRPPGFWDAAYAAWTDPSLSDEDAAYRAKASRQMLRRRFGPRPAAAVPPEVPVPASPPSPFRDPPLWGAGACDGQLTAYVEMLALARVPVAVVARLTGMSVPAAGRKVRAVLARPGLPCEAPPAAPGRAAPCSPRPLPEEKAPWPRLRDREQPAPAPKPVPSGRPWGMDAMRGPDPLAPLRLRQSLAASKGRV